MTDPISFRRRIVEQRLGLSGLVSPGGSSSAINLPVIVMIVVAAISLVSIFQFLSPLRISVIMDYTYGFVPEKLNQGLQNDADAFGLALPLVSHIFLHGSVSHLLFNMLMLTVFGAGVARRLATESGKSVDRAWNTGLFLTFFLACGVAGAAAYFFRSTDSLTPMIGASGAISGLMAASMRFALRRYSPYGVAQGPLAGLFAPGVVLVSLTYIGLNIATAFGAGIMGGDGANIAWDAHIGGYVFGLVSFPLFDWVARRGPGPASNVAPRFVH